MADLRKKIRKITLLLIISFLVFTFTIGASGCVAPEVEEEDPIEDTIAESIVEEEMEEDGTDIIETEEVEEMVEEEPQDMESDPCLNPYFPVEEGKVWNYTIESDGTDPFQYSLSFTDIEDSSFTQIVELPDATITSEWTCGDGGILENDFRQLDVNNSETGQVVKFETISVEGITFPAADLLEIGYTWNIAYDLKGTITTSDIETGADAKVAMDFEVIGFEDVKVPAGDFIDALKVSQNTTITITSDLFENRVVSGSTSWYAENVGFVKNEGNLNEIQTVTVLDSIE